MVHACRSRVLSWTSLTGPIAGRAKKSARGCLECRIASVQAGWIVVTRLRKRTSSCTAAAHTLLQLRTLLRFRRLFMLIPAPPIFFEWACIPKAKASGVCRSISSTGSALFSPVRCRFDGVVLSGQRRSIGGSRFASHVPRIPHPSPRQPFSSPFASTGLWSVYENGDGNGLRFKPPHPRKEAHAYERCAAVTCRDVAEPAKRRREDGLLP